MSPEIGVGSLQTASLWEWSTLFHKGCAKGQPQSPQGPGGGNPEGRQSTGWEITGTVWEMAINPGTTLGV